MQQIHHGPQVAAFSTLIWEQVAQVVHFATARSAQVMRRRSIIRPRRLRDDTAQVGAVFARHVLPHVAADVFAEVDLALPVRGAVKDVSAVIRHAHVVGWPSHRVRCRRPCAGTRRSHAIGPAFRHHCSSWAANVPARVKVRSPGQVDVIGDLYFLRS